MTIEDKTPIETTPVDRPPATEAIPPIAPPLDIPIPWATRAEVDELRGRLQQTEDRLARLQTSADVFFDRMLDKLASVAPAIAEELAKGPELSEVTPVAEADKCPKHPDAPQTVNGCTAAGCTFSPPVRD